MNKRNKLIALLSATVLVASLLAQVYEPHKAYAAQITTRSLLLQPGATDGGSKPGGTVNHLISFTIPTTASIGSISFEYCTLAAGACVLPTDLDTSSVTLGSENGATGFTNIDTSTNGTVIIERTSATSVGPTQAVSYQLLGVLNPSVTNYTFYVRISTYGSLDGTGSAIDTGTVAASTATPIVLSGTMPESLVFCTGHTIGLTAGVPDCATADSGAIDFDKLFSPTDTATASSQMAASTNAGFGYNITVAGATLTSGSNTIPAMGTQALGTRGIGQFGLNLKANTVITSNPVVGTEVAPAANTTNYRGQALTNYDTVDQFTFISGNSVANSANGGAGGSDAQIFTVSYIANVPGSQPAGTYTTTLTYVCTPTF